MGAGGLRGRPDRPIEVSPVVANKARAVGADRWLRDLPDTVADLAHRWGLEVGRALADSTEAFVAEVTRADGSPAVLKVLIPRDRDPVGNEATVLRLDGGRACAQLYREDRGSGALLMERLGPSLHDLGLPIERRHRILCDLARLVWRPAADCGLPTGADQARWLGRHIVDSWERLDRPCSEPVIAQALDLAEQRGAAHDDERAVLVHGDVHEWNALLAGPSTYKLIDPDGLLAEPEYDLGVMMREDPVELLAGDPRLRSRWLAARAGLDETAIWQWGVIERVATGLLATEIELQPIGAQMLEAAERVVDA